LSPRFAFTETIAAENARDIFAITRLGFLMDLSKPQH